MSGTLMLSTLKLFTARMNPSFESVIRTRTGKHWNPKYKWHRKQKVIKTKLPDFNEDFASFSEEQKRLKMKERGLMPPRPWMERQIYISCTGGIFEEYIPPEGDGKMSSITPGGAKQKLQLLEKKSKSMMAIRKIKSFQEDFDRHKFAEEAQDIYIKAHESIVSKDRHALRLYVTEKAYPEFRHETLDKTIRWKFIKTLEPPRVVHARCTDVLSKENIFGQLTLRFHTQQQLAVYDRFGRLMHGSEIVAKDVLEYVVFENHLANMYGSWRIHAKIIPDWMPPREPIAKTFEDIPLPLIEDSKNEEKKEVAPADKDESTRLAAA